jgi:hypothetical protein
MDTTASSTVQDPNDVPPPLALIIFTNPAPRGSRQKKSTRGRSPGALKGIRNCLRVKQQDLMAAFQSPPKAGQPRRSRSPRIFQRGRRRSTGWDVEVNKQVKSK